MKRFFVFGVPLVAFVLLLGFLFSGLFSDPRSLDSQVQGKVMPAFVLPDLMQPDIEYSPEIFKGKVTILNVWGVWCVTCAIELPYLTELATTEKVSFVGLYFDQDLDPEFGTKTLNRVQQEVRDITDRFGNPYQFHIFDVYRDTALDLGVTGAPEHFLIDHHGVIRMHHVGDINQRVWQNKVGPMYKQLVLERQQETLPQ